MPSSNLSDTTKDEYILLIIIFIVILAILYNLWCLFGSGSNREKKHSIFNDNVAELRLYYAPWCGHSIVLIENGWRKCKKMIEEDDELNHLVHVKEIDCDNNNNTEKCSNSGIHGFPTIKLFINGREIEYAGDRSENSIIQFVKKNIN